MADGFVNLQAELRAIENNRALPFGTRSGVVQRDAFLGDARRVPKQIEFLDKFVAAQHVLPAETIRIRALLNFLSRKSGGYNSRARLHFHLMNHGADARNKKLFNFAE